MTRFKAKFSGEQSQKKLTDFFQPLPPKRKVRTRCVQKTLLDYIQSSITPKPPKKRGSPQKIAYDRAYNKTRSFIRKYCLDNSAYQFEGSRKAICYFSADDLSEVCAIDPKTRRKIGWLRMDDDYWLEAIEVDQDYRHKGIGSHLIRIANKITHKHLTISGSCEINSRYRLTNEGAALIEFCIDKNILAYEQYIQVAIPSPSHSYNF